MKSHELKSLESRRAKKQVSIEETKEQIKHMQRTLAVLVSELSNIDEQIKQLAAPTELVVSEHALLRYFERILGFNLSTISSSIIEAIPITTTGKYPINGGRAVVKGNVVVTIE